LAGLYYRSGKFIETRKTMEALENDPEKPSDLTNLVDACYVDICLRMRDLAGCGKGSFSNNVLVIKSAIKEMQRLSQQAKWPRGVAYADMELGAILALLHPKPRG